MQGVKGMRIDGTRVLELRAFPLLDSEICWLPRAPTAQEPMPKPAQLSSFVDRCKFWDSF